MTTLMQRVYKSTRHCLRGGVRFVGRDNPWRFWPYAICVVLGQIVAGIAIMALAFAVAVFHTRPYYDPGAAAIPLIWGATAALAAGGVLLLAAGVVRRLHDANRTGFWALLPLPFLVFDVLGCGLVMRDLGDDHPDAALFMLMFADTLLYLVALAMLAALMAAKGTQGPNRFGPQPGP